MKSAALLIVVEGLMSRTASRRPAVINLNLHRFEQQTLIALSTTEAKYMALSMAMHEQLPLLHLLQEAVANNIDMNLCPATIHSKAFEDNSRALEMAKVPKLHLCTKHLNTTIVKMCKHDLLTKPLSEDLFISFRHQLLHPSLTDA